MFTYRVIYPGFTDRDLRDTEADRQSRPVIFLLQSHIRTQNQRSSNEALQTSIKQESELQETILYNASHQSMERTTHECCQRQNCQRLQKPIRQLLVKTGYGIKKAYSLNYHIIPSNLKCKCKCKQPRTILI